MTALHNLIAACQADEARLDAQTQTHIAAWQRWLMPVSETNPVGDDPGYDDDYQRIREEMNRLSGIDTDLICTLAEKLLTQTCKDLRVVTFYIWARLHRDGEIGLAEGLELLAGLLQRFGAALLPQRVRSRNGALEWLHSDRMLDSLSLWPEVDPAVMQRIVGALWQVEQGLTALADGQQAARVNLSKLYQALETRLAQSGGARSLVPQTSRTEEAGAAPARAPADNIDIRSGRDLLDQAKQLARYLREQPEGWLAAHHLLKSVRWDTLTQLPPLDASGRTRLAPPKPDHRAQLKRLHLQQRWTELLELSDTLFAQGVNHLWLDVQWYAWQALQKNDGDLIRADILGRDLQNLLTRLPGLETLAFNDGTPFADETTLGWIRQHILSDGDDWHDEAVSVTAGDEDALLALEPEVLARADSEGVEAAFTWLQSRPDTASPRSQWLMRLLMARVAEQYGKNDMALHLLGELDERARQLTLAQWTPAIVFEVKARRLKLLRVKAARSEAEKSRLQAEMDTLLAGLIALDPARAAVLCG